MKELKIEINKLLLSNGQLENDLFECKAQVTRLEKQKETLTKKTSDHGNIESHNKLKESFDQMNQKYEESQKELEEKKKEISIHQVSLTIFYKRGLLFSIVSCCFLLPSYHFKLSSLESRICEMIPGAEYETLTLGPILLMMMSIVIINITFIF